MEAPFTWLKVPKPGQTPVLDAIFRALEVLRGQSRFATFGRPLGCDFYAPDWHLIIEYDERQHFTAQRADALALYPKECPLGFKRDEWMNACKAIDAHDNRPPYRDEQRAFYDSVRDILAVENRFILVRIKDRATDWTKPGAASDLDAILQPLQLVDRRRVANW